MRLELPAETHSIVRRALLEDIGAGDVTTLATIPPDLQAEGIILARGSGVIAGLPVVEEVYAQLDPSVSVTPAVVEGARVEVDELVGTVVGSARAILIGERVALNFLQRLSGIATRTAAFVAMVGADKPRIVDTRKTAPGLRSLERYAVRAGGGFNHRSGLYDAILIKDNHITAAGGLSVAVERAFAVASHVMTCTVECKTLDQVEEAAGANVDVILLDNMSIDAIRQAVAAVHGETSIEASGNITEQNVAEIAAAGVDFISVGGLTHSAPALDLSMQLNVAQT